MAAERGSIETTKAVCGPAISPNRDVNQNSNEGQPRVGKLFFIHREVDNVSLSSMSSDPTAYTETEIMENRRDYPLSVNYALSVTASSANSSVSSVTHHGIAKFKSRSILTALRRKPLVDRAEISDIGDEDALPAYVPKTWLKDPAVNTSTDPTIDLENQPSQEESSNGIPVDEESVLSKGCSSTSSLSEGFGGYIYQNCSELNPRTTKVFILTASMLLLFGVSAVVAAIIVDGSPAKSGAGYKQLTSLYDSPTVGIPSPSAEDPETAVDPPSIGNTPTIADTTALLQVTTTTAPSISPSTAPTIENASNDEPLWIISDTTTSEATTLSVDPSTTDATISLTVTSPSTTSTTSTQAAKSTTTARPSTTISPSKLYATYIQAIANSFLVEAREYVEGKVDDEENKNAKANKEDGHKDEGEDDVANFVNVETIVRFDISPMLNDPRGTPFRVIMHPGSNNKDFKDISLDYLPKAGLWGCSPCERAHISSDNSVDLGTFDKDGFVDIASAFSRGIFDNQMTFRLYSSEMLPAPKLVLLWVEGNDDDFAGLSTASLMEMVSEDEDISN